MVVPTALHAVKCRLLVLRDVLGVLLLFQAWLIVLAAVVGGCNDAAGHHLTNRFPHISPYPLYYLFSVLLSLALLGVFGLLASLFGWDERLLLRGDRYAERDGQCDDDCCCDGPDCDGGLASCCDGDDDGCGPLILCLLLVFATVGLVYGFVYGSVLVERTVRRHMKQSWFRSEVDTYRVVDWKDRQYELRAERESIGTITTSAPAPPRPPRRHSGRC